MAKYGVLALACLLAAVSVASAQNVTLIAGLPVSGYFYVQHFAPSLLSGAGNTVPGGGGRRLLADNQNTVRSLLQVPPTNTTTTAAEALSTAAAANAILASNSGRKLLQFPKFGGAPLNGLQITYAAKMDHSGRATVLLEFPATTGNSVILAALVAQQPTGVAAVPATFFNAEVAIGSAIAVSKNGFVAVNGGVVRVRLTFDLLGSNTLPALQISWQYASNLLPPQPPYFFLNADVVVVVPDKAGLPTLKGLIGTLQDST